MINVIRYKIYIYKIKKYMKKVKPINMYISLNILESHKEAFLKKDYQKLYDETMKKYPSYKKRMNAIPREIAFKDI